MPPIVEASTAPNAAWTDRPHMPRLPMLDGWRAISILAVLAAHFLPLGPKGWALNESFGVFGMAIFFVLSGFLITSTLYFNPNVRTFAIRRLFRVIPAAWLFIVVVLPFAHASLLTWLASLFFYANLPPFHLLPITAHLWSLCVEIQFYGGIALLFLLLRSRGLALLPVICLAVTIGRVITGSPVSVMTYFRVDEILAGASLAWLFHGPLAARLRSGLTRINPFIPLVLLCAASHPMLPWFEYVRPYLAATLVGTTLFAVGSRWNTLLESKRLAYLATISYALYIWHPLAMHGWFDSDSKMLKYARRPLGIALSFLIAHISTFYFERPMVEIGKRLTPSAKPRRPAQIPVGESS